MSEKKHLSNLPMFGDFRMRISPLMVDRSGEKVVHINNPAIADGIIWAFNNMGCRMALAAAI